MKALRPPRTRVLMVIPRRTNGHGHASIRSLASCSVRTGDFRQLVRRQFGQIVTRMHLTLKASLAASSGVTPSSSNRSCAVSRRLPGRSPRSAAHCGRAQLIDGVLFVERLDFQQFLHGNVGDFSIPCKPSSIRMSATSSSTSSLFMNVARSGPLDFLAVQAFFRRHDVDLPAGQLGRQAHVLAWRRWPWRFSSSTTTSIACLSSSTTMDSTLAGASAPITNCAPGLRTTARYRPVRRPARYGPRSRANRACPQVPMGSDALIVSHHGDLRARAGITGGGLDFEQALLDLGHFVLEQRRDEFPARCATRMTCWPRAAWSTRST